VDGVPRGAPVPTAPRAPPVFSAARPLYFKCHYAEIAKSAEIAEIAEKSCCFVVRC